MIFLENGSTESSLSFGQLVLVSDVDRVEHFRLTLRFFDDVSTASWFTFSIPTSNLSMTRRNFQSVLSMLFLFSHKSSW